MPGELTPLQERFVTEYLVDLHQRNAAIRAGYSPESADTIASQVMKLPQVQAEIAQRTAAFAARRRLQGKSPGHLKGHSLQRLHESIR